MADAASATITGNLNLGGEVRSFTIADGAVANDMNISAVVSNGGLTKAGAGTLTLSAANTYAGTTTISEGKLQLGDGAANGSLGSGNVVNNSTLAFKYGSNDIFSNNVSGSGNLTVLAGGSTVTLTGNNTYVGTTTINSGAQMYVGDGDSGGDGTHGTLGSGGVITNGTLHIARNGSGTPVTIANDISGTGSVYINYGASGTIIFTGNNTYSNQTYVKSGVTLQIGGGGVSGTLGSGEVITHGTLAFDRSDGITAGNYIYGNGAVKQAGAGALTLTNGNNYSGGTILDEGTLNINHATAIGTGALTINGGTIDNTSGAGITLTNNNAQNWNADFTFTGTNDLNFGTGAVSLSAARQVTVADGVLTLGGTVSGLGSGLTKAGAGILTLSGANTYTGVTSVTAGKLIDAGSIADTSALTVNGNTAIFDLGSDHSDTLGTVTLQGGGSITGSGTSALTTTGSFEMQSGSVTAVLAGVGRSLNKTTAGSVTLDAVNAYTGATTVSAGNLILNGSIASSSHTTVQTGGRLTGSGTTGNLTIASGGTLAPGSSPGTISTVGDATYAGGGTYTWEINDAAGTEGTDPGWDLHDVTGDLNITATPGGTFTIAITSLTLGNVSGAATNFEASSDYAWAIARAGTITGFDAADFTLSTANFENAFSGVFSIVIAGNEIQIIYSGGRISYVEDAVDPNAKAVGTVLDEIKAGGAEGDMLNVLNALDGMSADQRSDAMETMSPDTSSGNVQGSQALSNMFFGGVSNRLGFTRNGMAQSGIASGGMVHGVGFWMQGLGSHVKQDARKGVEGYQANTFGTIIGVDKLLDAHLRLGIAGGFGFANVNSKAAGSPSSDITSWQGMLYGSYDSLNQCGDRKSKRGPAGGVRNPGEDSWYVDGMLGFTQNSYDNRRMIYLPGDNRVAKSDSYGQQYSTRFETGYTFVTEKTKALEFTPFASLSYGYLYMNKYKENGAGALNLTVDGEGFNQLEQGLGVKVAYPIHSKKAGIFIPSVKAAWVYDYMNDRFETTASFAGGGPAFESQGAKPARNGCLFGAELAFLNKGNMTLTGNYDLELKDQFQSHTYYATARFDF